MTIRTFVDKNGNSWEWDETPEVIAALEKLNKIITNNKEILPVVITDVR